MITNEIREKRRSFICSSDVSAIFGLSPFADSTDVWVDKMYGTKDWENDSMNMGNLTEPYIIESVCQHYDIPYEQAITDGESLWRESKDFQLFACNLDCDHPPIEAKYTTFADEWGFSGSQEIPRHFYLQVQHQLLVTGYDFSYVGVWICNYGIDMRFYKISRNDKVIRDIREICTAWWEKYVVGDVMPKPTLARDDNVKRIKTKPNTSVKVDPDLWSELDEAKLAEKEAKERVKKANKRLLLARKDAEAIEMPDGKYYVLKTENNGFKCDQDKLREEHPEIFDKYFTERTRQMPRIVKGE